MHFYFVHPQIKLTQAVRAKLALLKRPNRDKIKGRLTSYFPEKQFIFTDMGRSAFKVIIEKLNLQNSEILLPAYICDIFYPIIRSYNMRPVFLEIDPKTLHVTAEEISKKITPDSKAVLVCHTYGLPADIASIKKVVGGKVVIIEDCAHAFFATRDGVYAGSSGTVSFFSLYKQFPTLRGGMVVCPREWRVDLPETRFNFRDFISFLNYFPPLAFLFKKVGSEIAPKIPRKEKMENPAGINNASLSLFSEFFKEVEKSVDHRKKIAMLFIKGLKEMNFEVQDTSNNVFCYLSAMVPKEMIGKRDDIVKNLRRYGILCTRIWHTPIILNKDTQEDYDINLTEFPNTIDAAKRIINFPLQNHYTEKDVERMINALRRVIVGL
jgi:dTDP-4-amino-4,6-dideoxygalactose transaminase